MGKGELGGIELQYTRVRWWPRSRVRLVMVMAVGLEGKATDSNRNLGVRLSWAGGSSREEESGDRSSEQYTLSSDPSSFSV
jgi:hypothetical protein